MPAFDVLTALPGAAPAWRTILMERPAAERTKAMLEANPRFQNVRIEEHPQAKSRKTGEPSAARYKVVYESVNGKAIAAAVADQADARKVRALQQYDDYVIYRDLDHPGLYKVCKVSTGEIYDLTRERPTACDCHDYVDRCAPAGILCKHFELVTLAEGRGEVVPMGGPSAPVIGGQRADAAPDVSDLFEDDGLPLPADILAAAIEEAERRQWEEDAIPAPPRRTPAEVEADRRLWD
jgi:hypothetical protein